jgi:hypothetical protein
MPPKGWTCGKLPVKTGRRKLLTRRALLDYLCSTVDEEMNREKLVRIIQELLRTDQDLAFLAELKREHLERLVACVRDRIDH